MNEVEKMKTQLKVDRAGLKTALGNLRIFKSEFSKAVKDSNQAAIDEAASKVQKADTTVKRFRGKVKATKNRLHNARVSAQPKIVRKAISNGTFRKVIRYSTYGITALTLLAGGIITYKAVSTDEAPTTTDEV